MLIMCVMKCIPLPIGGGGGRERERENESVSYKYIPSDRNSILKS